jgi:hypothetical protein
MPAGSGPAISAPVTAGSITTVANAFTISSVTGNWNQESGMLVTVTVYWTPSATQTLTAKCYQGAGVAGTQVGPSGGLVATGTGATEQEATFAFVDQSAYGQAQQQGQYTTGLTVSTGTGTVDYAFTELETIAPLS